MADSAGGPLVPRMPPESEANTTPDRLAPKLSKYRQPAERLAYGKSVAVRRSAVETSRSPVSALLGGFTRTALVRYPGVKAIPFRAICHLSVQYEDGQLANGSGFLVGERTVLTAGHCVFMPGVGQAVNVTVVPAQDDTAAPYGWSEATLVDFSREWRDTDLDSPNPRYDFGAVFLPTPKLQTRVGHMLKFSALPNQRLEAMQVANVAGYPDHQDGMSIMERDNGPLVIDEDHPIDDHLIYHAIPTQEGQSGAPIMHFDNATSDVTVFGIHTYGGDVANVGRRIDTDLVDIIRRWVTDPRPFMSGAQES